MFLLMFSEAQQCAIVIIVGIRCHVCVRKQCNGTRVCVCVYNCYSDDVIQHESCLRFFGYDLRVFTIIKFHFMCRRGGGGM